MISAARMLLNCCTSAFLCPSWMQLLQLFHSVSDQLDFTLWGLDALCRLLLKCVDHPNFGESLVICDNKRQGSRAESGDTSLLDEAIFQHVGFGCSGGVVDLAD